MPFNLKSYLKIARIGDWRGYLLGGTFGFLLARGYLFPPKDIFLFFLAGISFLTFGFAVNDCFDVKGDELKKDKFIIVGRKISFKRAFLFSFLSGALGLLFSFAFGWGAFLCALTAVLLAFFYSAPPLRLKSKPFLDLLSHGFFAGVLIFLFPILAFQKEINQLDYLLSVPIFFLSITAEMRNHLADYSIDKIANLKTSAAFLGYENSQKILKAIIFLYPITLFPIFFLFPEYHPLIFTALTLAFIFLFLWRKNYQDLDDFRLINGYVLSSFGLILLATIW